MATIIELLQSSTKAPHTSAHANQVDIVQMAPGKTRDQIVATTSMCEVLSDSIDTLQKSIKRLNGIVSMIDDDATRESLEHQIAKMHVSLSLESARLSGIMRRIQPALHCAYRPV
ncbi:precorrin isomerase [Nitrobacteraceae bacterium AZCC 2146]